MHLDEAHGKRSSFYISELGKIYVFNQSTYSFIPLPLPRLPKELAQPLHHVPRGLGLGRGAPLALVPGDVVVAGVVGPVPAVAHLGLPRVGAAAVLRHVAPAVVGLAVGVDVAVPLPG